MTDDKEAARRCLLKYQTNGKLSVGAARFVLNSFDR